MEGAGLPPHYVEYHKILEDEINRQYGVGSSAKSQGSDPSLDVESPLALDLADRVAKLLEVPVAERLRETPEEHQPDGDCCPNTCKGGRFWKISATGGSESCRSLP